MKFIEVLKNPYKVIPYMGRKGLLNWVKDETYIKLLYRSYEGEKLNLENPMTFNEKLQWLKLNDRNPLYTQLVDKYNVREYVEEKLGDEYLIPLIGVYDNVDEIDFENLPQSFVLKCTHDSGSVIVCDNKSKLDLNLVKERLKKALKRNFYYCNREWPYKDVNPKIVCEKMLDSQIIDYKIFCFNGEPKFLYVGQGLVSDHSLKIDFYDLDWNKMNFKRTDYDNFDGYIERPKKLEDMVEIAKKLSKEITFVRIDLYEVEGKLYFSEFTFTPGGGYIPLSPLKYERKLGDLLKLPK